MTWLTIVVALWKYAATCLFGSSMILTNSFEAIMSRMWGADTTALREFATQLERGVTELTEIGARVDYLTSAAHWNGADRDRFISEWAQSLQPMLTTCRARIEEASGSVLQHAEAQDRASAADSPGISAVGAGLRAGGLGEGGVSTLGGPAPAAPPKKPKRDLKEIMRDYQVTEAEMVEWRPPWPFNDDARAVYLTVKEADMLNALAWQVPGSGFLQFQYAKDRAMELANVNFPEQGNLDGHNDAFRHAMWSALMVRKFGANWAEDYATAHEQVPGMPPGGTAMDLYNNEMGRRIATNYPDASEEELAEHIVRAVTKGDMIVINQEGSIAWSDQVEPGLTGLANEDESHGGKIPRFHDGFFEYNKPNYEGR